GRRCDPTRWRRVENRRGTAAAPRRRSRPGKGKFQPTGRSCLRPRDRRFRVRRAACRTGKSCNPPRRSSAACGSPGAPVRRAAYRAVPPVEANPSRAAGRTRPSPSGRRYVTHRTRATVRQALAFPLRAGTWLAAMKELCLVAVVNDGYQEYIPLFVYFALYAYPEYEVIVYLEGTLHPEVD